MNATKAPPLTSVLFARGVIARLVVWPILRLAVQENWGGPNGPEKRTWLASVIVDAFEEQSPPPDDQYIEEILLQVMADEFETQIEDGSAEPVAVDVVQLWEQCHAGQDVLVRKFEDAAEKLKGKKMDVPQTSGDDEEWEDDDGSDESGEEEEIDDEPVPQLLNHRQKEEPEIDEDGFTLVKGKGRR
ncbi:Pre-rRNA-processing protein TSR2-domain-containing protein [Desarmillaria tabescens]|uniref:Pre-rRNA-processing protein TSR2-domain-containing protein n=1 Tax=Armillaria tabescens TaxID=1929756 RepID=A0AA39K920_ARMTA|nr:Pre-rRNA-processing protein TSR2-domain-containing protein [Desarmillaria tabescens]KAK0455670.1 Pre-rRNA-processing protein TSR2-domain-containing protein [Desarmillaria tabescens]